ncbi:DUF4234 domain-containing protein [Teredinibacter turnerae]|uniref:DUF4234 domain-containing protein n=1 Tax=Teredinibacter turnerae TaxID=2426 RepID=UPI000380C56C|nr:DUF4234 domain-containing protein [Teredinibacter turnerae]
MTETANPYSAPQSEVNAPSAGKLSAIFPRFTAWAVFGLGVITLGIYSFYWLFSRTRQINPVIENPISPLFMGATLGLYFIGFASNIPLGNPTVTMVLSLLSLAGSIMFVIWAFRLRSRIHQVANISVSDPSRIGPILTFFFSVIYLQYKINQYIDAE